MPMMNTAQPPVSPPQGQQGPPQQGVLFGQGGGGQPGGEQDINQAIQQAISQMSPEILQQIAAMPKEDALTALTQMNIEAGQSEDMALLIADTVYQMVLDRFAQEGGDLEQVNPDFFQTGGGEAGPPQGQMQGTPPQGGGGVLFGGQGGYSRGTPG